MFTTMYYNIIIKGMLVKVHIIITYYFYQLAYWDLKVPKRLNQMQCSLLLTATGANKTTPLHVGTSYTHAFGFYSKANVSATHQIAWEGHWTPNCVGGMGCAPFEPPLTGGHLAFKFSPYLLFRAKGDRKPSTF